MDACHQRNDGKPSWRKQPVKMKNKNNLEKKESLQRRDLQPKSSGQMMHEIAEQSVYCVDIPQQQKILFNRHDLMCNKRVQKIRFCTLF